MLCINATCLVHQSSPSVGVLGLCPFSTVDRNVAQTNAVEVRCSYLRDVSDAVEVM